MVDKLEIEKINMKLEKFSLKGKNAIVTGAAGLLGYEHTFALLENGARVWMLDIDKVKVENSKKVLIKYFSEEFIHTAKVDITKENELLDFSKLLDNKNIRIDILINNAAIDPKVTDQIEDFETSRFENFSLNEWNLQLNVGLTGAFLCSKTFGFKMSLDNKGGVILNIASDLSVISPDNRLYENQKLKDNLQPVKPVAYSVVKSGLIGLTKYLSTYWAKQNIRCNALSPGGVFNNQDDVFIKKLEKLIPMGRMANKNEYRSSIQYLCSDASSYLTGQNIIVDGGRSIW